MVVTDELTLRLLTTQRSWTDRRRLSTAATAVLLTNHGSAHLHAGLDGVRSGRFRIDSKLIADLYAVLPKRLRIALLATTAAARLDPKTFRALFLPLYRDPSLTPRQRKALLFESFSPNVGLGNAEENRDVIVEMLRSKDPEIRLRGLLKAGHLNYLSRADLEFMRRKMQSKGYARYNACNGLCELVKRPKEIHPSVLEFCLQPEISRIADRICRKDRDPGARLCGYFLLKALRRAGGPIAPPGERPRWAPYDRLYGRARRSKRSTAKR